MTEDDLVARLRDHARDESRDDATWERVSAGTASAEELAALERRAETDAEVAAMLEATRPLGDAAADRIAERLARERAAGAEVVPLAAARPRAAARTALLRRAGVLAMPLALAAAVVLYVTSSRDGGGSLPEYSVSAVGERAMRGPAEPDGRLRVGKEAASTFELVLRPETAVAEPLVAYAFAISGGEPSAVDAEVHVAESGAVRVKGEARALGSARELRVVVGPAEAIGRYEGALARAAAGTSDARVRVLTVAIDRD